ncbi:hypothetical protein [Paenibacillus polysaccharolyticus]|uniref:hypothetical protein n=1 Tax=Paenibacillus polysaccharolyticus TaxID=582692 RepID=UPI00280B03C7|nr:hypothetical protein [Paenibacillus polysaccharolyticus]
MPIFIIYQGVIIILTAQVTDSTPIHIGTPITFYIPYIEWIATFILLVIGIVFIIRIGKRIIKLMDLIIIEKQNHKLSVKDKKDKNSLN